MLSKSMKTARRSRSVIRRSAQVLWCRAGCSSAVCSAKRQAPEGPAARLRASSPQGQQREALCTISPLDRSCSIAHDEGLAADDVLNELDRHLRRDAEDASTGSGGHRVEYV